MLDKEDEAELAEFPPKLISTHETFEVLSDKLFSDDSIEILSPKSGPPELLNSQSNFESLFQDPVSNNPDPTDSQIQEKTMDILLMTPNDFQLPKTEDSKNDFQLPKMEDSKNLRSEVIDTRNLLLNYKEQRQKLR